MKYIIDLYESFSVAMHCNYLAQAGEWEQIKEILNGDKEIA